MKRAPAAQIIDVGDAACLVRLARRPGPTASRRVMALVASLDAAPPPGLTDIIPAYTSVLVRFDPMMVTSSTMHDALCGLLDRVQDTPLPSGRLVRIPVSYGGADGPDLDAVARLLGLSPADIIKGHSSATYRVAFLGFLAGFPYLSGLPRALAVPRLDTPRTRVPPGSVAIAEHQAGIYPVESPGGWRILGRTEARLFDPRRDPPSLFRPGDRVRFYPVANAERTPIAASEPSRTTHAVAESGVPWLRVLAPGIQTTVQDHGRQGYARFGVSASGAADGDALSVGNALLANPGDAAALEITGGNASFEALSPSIVAVVGTPCDVHVNRRFLHQGVTFALEAGDTLELGATSAGMRVYLCAEGGIAVPCVMGSRATDLRAHLGGLDGRALCAGDVLFREPGRASAAGRILPRDLAHLLPTNNEWELRILPGSGAPWASTTLERLLCASFVVDPRADRVGVRLRQVDGPCMEGGQVVSEGLPRGAVQVPPDGEPVLLLADAQATGGYHVPAVVISADLWRIGQLRPHSIVRFHRATLDEAAAAARQRADEVARIQQQPSPARLLSGFAEWSDDAELTMS